MSARVSEHGVTAACRAAGRESPAVTRYHSDCPVCGSARWSFLAPRWRGYYQPADLTIDDSRWFAECARCATVVMLPLPEYACPDTYGMSYYDQHGPRESAEEHAISHFEDFQKSNYDNIHEYLRRTHPAGAYPRWLDVGSVGYPTTFRDYAFTTIEPDPRAVRAGRRHFATDRIHCATIETWSGGGAFDGVLFNNSFYCVTTPGAALDAAHALLRPGGRLVVTLATFLNGAVADREDGRILLIEDVLYGETLQVYYNAHSLTYLAGLHGFRLLDDTEVPAYGHKTMRAYAFERVDARVRDDAELDRSRQYMAERWNTCFSGFRASIAETLRQCNNPRTVLAGSSTVVRDLQRYGELSRVRGFLPVPETFVRGCSLGCVRVLGPEDLANVPAHDYEVAICDLRTPRETAEAVRHLLGPAVRLRLPTRRSGMNFIDFSFRDGLQPSKGLHFGPTRRPVPPDRVAVGRRRIVVFGAGAGGRRVLAAMRDAGASGRVAAVCDNDTSRVGTIVDGHRVTRFEELAPAQFDFVIIASVPGREAIGRQLAAAGLVERLEFAGLECLSSGDVPWA